MKKQNTLALSFTPAFRGILFALFFLIFLNAGPIHTRAACAYGQDDAGNCLSAPTTQTTNATPAVTNSTPAAQTCPNGVDDAGTCYPATTNNTSGTLVNPLNASSLQQLLVEILGYVTYLGSIFLVLALVYVGFLFVMAQGAPEAVSKARYALLCTAIGGLLLLGASAIALVISSTVQAL